MISPINSGWLVPLTPLIQMDESTVVTTPHPHMATPLSQRHQGIAPHLLCALYCECMMIESRSVKTRILDAVVVIVYLWLERAAHSRDDIHFFGLYLSP